MEENKVMNIELTPEMFEKLDDSKRIAKNRLRK